MFYTELENKELIDIYSEALIKNDNRISIIEKELGKREFEQEDYEWIQIISKDKGRNLKIKKVRKIEKEIDIEMSKIYNYKAIKDIEIIKRYLTKNISENEMEDLDMEVRKRKLHKKNELIKEIYENRKRIKSKLSFRNLFKKKFLLYIMATILLIQSYININIIYLIGKYKSPINKEYSNEYYCIHNNIQECEMFQNPLNGKSVTGYYLDLYEIVEKYTKGSTTRKKYPKTIYFEDKLSKKFSIQEDNKIFYLNLDIINKPHNYINLKALKNYVEIKNISWDIDYKEFKKIDEIPKYILKNMNNIQIEKIKLILTSKSIYLENGKLHSVEGLKYNIIGKFSSDDNINYRLDISKKFLITDQNLSSLKNDLIEMEIKKIIVIIFIVIIVHFIKIFINKIKRRYRRG